MSVISAKTQTGDDLPGFVTPDGKVRLLAALPNQGFYKVTPYGAANEVYDRKDWIAFANQRKDVPIMNQGSVGSCNPHGATSTVMKSRAKSGQAFQLLSAAGLYGLINDGRDAGSTPEDAAQQIVEFGIPLDSEMPERFYRERDTRQHAETAKRFRVEEAALYQGHTFDELVSALIDGRDCWYTVLVAGNWNRFDDDGCPPAYRGYGNHVTSDDDSLIITPKGRPLVPTRNSWGLEWGDNGRYNLSEEHVENQPGFVFYALEYPGQDPLDPNIAPSG